MFVALTDFLVNPYLIAYKTGENSNGLTSFIELKEREILEKTLGLLFYRQMAAGVNALPAEWVVATNYSIGNQVVYGINIYEASSSGSGNIPGVSAQWVLQPVNKWLRLKVGEEYMNEGRENVWVGMKEALKPYIHAMYLRDYATSITATGLVKHVSENSEPANPNQRIMFGYNRFSDYVGGSGYYGFFMNADPYFWDDYYEDCLYGYLYYKNTLFDSEVNTKGYNDFRHYLSEKFCFHGYVNTMNI
jgi:hypothetical protein